MDPAEPGGGHFVISAENVTAPFTPTVAVLSLRHHSFRLYKFCGFDPIRKSICIQINDFPVTRLDSRENVSTRATPVLHPHFLLFSYPQIAHSIRFRAVKSDQP